jgi:hypothetical protein
MSFTATVENGTIKLPPGVNLPDGTQVWVESAVRPNVVEETDSLSAFLESYAGCINSGLGDVAENHDHYAHGAPKGSDRH